MSRRPGGVRATVHSISCAPSEWERIRERAAAEGKSMSRYIVDRALTREPRDPEKGAQLVLDADEQRALCDVVTRIAAEMSERMFQDAAESPNMANAVRVLFETKLDEMTRRGRYAEMKALLDEVFDAERAERIGAAVYERNRRKTYMLHDSPGRRETCAS